MASRINRAKRVLREEGWLALPWKLILFIKHLLFSYSNYNIMESALDPPDIKSEVNDLTLRIITSAAEIDQLVSEQTVDEDFEIPRHKEIVDKGAILFYAFVGEELAHDGQVFISREAHESYPFSWTRQAGHTVGLAAYTAPKYRRKGIHSYTPYPNTPLS